MNKLPVEKNRRILIIDDNHAIHDDFRKILSPAAPAAALDVTEAELFGKPVPHGGMVQQIRYQIDSAYQGQDGVLLVKQALEAGHPYAMAFVDVRMPPGMDGVETARKIWELDPDLQVVLCTAYSDYSWGEMFEKLGHHDGLLILKKPFDTVEALQLAQALTEKWWLHRQSRRKMEELENLVAGRTRELQQSNQTLQTEVAEHQRAEETLRESEERFSGAFEYAPIGVALVTANGHYFKVNRALCDLVGYTKAEMLTRTFQDITHPEDIEADLENVRRLLAGDIHSYQMEKRYVHARGHSVTVLLNVSLIRDGQGQPRYFISQVQDITERKRAAEALAAEQRLLNGLITATPDTIYFKDLESRFTRTNEAFVRKHGLSDTSAALGKTDFDLFGVEHARQAYADEQRIMASGQPMINQEEREDWKNGRVTWVSSTKMPLRDAAGKIIGIMGISRDITERKQAEVALRRQNEYLTALQETMLDVISQLDLEQLLENIIKRAGQLMGTSTGFLALLEPGDDHLTSKIALGVLAEESLKYKNKVGEGMAGEVWRTGQPMLVEDYDAWPGRIKSHQKSLIHSIIQVPLVSKSGFVGVLGLAHEKGPNRTFGPEALQQLSQLARFATIAIENARLYSTAQQELAKRKQAEEVLRDSETFLNTVIEKIPHMIFVKDAKELRFVKFNQAGQKLLGYSLAELAGKNDRDLFPKEMADNFTENDRKVLRGQEVVDIPEEPVQTRDKGERILHTKKVPVFDNAGQLVYLLGISEDITERKQLEAELNRERNLWRTLLDNSPDHIYFKDTQSCFIKSSKAQALQFGVKSPDELVGKSDFDFFTEAHSRPAFEDEQEIIRSGRPVIDKEEREVWKDGHVTWAASTKMPMRDAAGKVIGIMGISRDITERKRLETHLIQSQKMETVGKLAGGIAHEFNSILTAIIGQSELLLGDLPAGSPLAKNAAEISQAADRAAVLTRQLLAYGRKQFLRPEALNLNQVITGMHGVLSHLMGGETVEVNIVPAAGLQMVKADAGQVEQVIMNLAMNARDAMPHGGQLTLETANVSFDHDSVGRNPELKPGAYVMLAITDTGRGMSDKVKAHAFEPFFTTKDIGQGTGLGLSTCYGIVKQSGGHINVYSELGRGTTFKIYLPQVEAPAQVPVGRLDSPDLPRGTETILLVEDDPALREMAATLLRRLGYTVLAAANGIEALSLKQQDDTGHVDLLFTDVVMPHMSGKELSDRVRSLYPHTRILFTSAYTENAIVHQGVLDKGVALLQKPFTPSALALKVREALDAPCALKPAFAGPEPASGVAGEATARRKPETARKTAGLAKISDEAMTPEI